MIRAVMICDYRNPISVAYSKIALKTWEDVRNVEVERFQCYTPDTINDAPFKINWGRYSSAGKYKTTRHEITPTEKACLTSMFHWWKHIAETGERVIILEHDAYVTNPKKMTQLIEDMDEKDIWIPGMAMECCSMSVRFAQYCMKKWLTIGEMVDAGPMAELWTALEEWDAHIRRYDSKVEKQILSELGLKKRMRVLWPTLHNDLKLGMGNDLTRVLKGKVGLQNAPVTQCYFPGHNTLSHHETIGDAQYHKGTMRQFHILEKLYDKK